MRCRWNDSVSSNKEKNTFQMYLSVPVHFFEFSRARFYIIALASSWKEGAEPSKHLRWGLLEKYLKSLTIFAKNPILDAWLDSEYDHDRFISVTLSIIIKEILKL